MKLNPILKLYPSQNTNFKTENQWSLYEKYNQYKNFV